MHASVRNYFIKFNEPIEARVEYMYLDIKGLVTLGVGNLIDVENASDTKNLKKVMEKLVTLPFVYKEKHRDAGKPANKADIEAEWKKVKGRQELAKVKLSYLLFAAITDLKLKNEAIDALVLKKLNEMETELKMDPAFQGFEQWPADAQLGLLSMAWALGTPKLKAHWPHFKTACKKQDFDATLKHCEINTVGNPGVAKRNTENRHLFRNATAVVANKGRNPAENLNERMTLYYPNMVLKKITIRG